MARMSRDPAADPRTSWHVAAWAIAIIGVAMWAALMTLVFRDWP